MLYSHPLSGADPSSDAESQFLEGLVELQYGLHVEHKLRSLSNQIHWAEGWPSKTTAFWNAEAFMWRAKIDEPTRALIAHKLAFLSGKKNLDVGCGAYSYVPSVGFDVSAKMLAFNDLCYKKVEGDLEKPLPFASNSFDSVTGVFVLNYIQSLVLFLQESKRILHSRGVFVAVLSVHPINDWQRQKQVWDKNRSEWQSTLHQSFSSVRVEQEKNLLFFYCTKNFKT